MQVTSVLGATPLCSASQGGRVGVVKTLLEARTNVDAATSDEGTTPLCHACEEGDVEVAKLLLVQASNELRPNDVSCRLDREKCLSLLLANNEDFFPCGSRQE